MARGLATSHPSALPFSRMSYTSKTRLRATCEIAAQSIGHGGMVSVLYTTRKMIEVARNRGQHPCAGAARERQYYAGWRLW